MRIRREYVASGDFYNVNLHSMDEEENLGICEAGLSSLSLTADSTIVLNSVTVVGPSSKGRTKLLTVVKIRSCFTESSYDTESKIETKDKSAKNRLRRFGYKPWCLPLNMNLFETENVWLLVSDDGKYRQFG